tara:strand:+ start:88 stop:255 length:168 start_codon:yes stop_codon:yes gene_type:complete
MFNKDLSENDKTILTNMFNSIFNDLIAMGCDKTKAIIIARQKVKENASIALKCYY